jgi:hypothetical protein
MPLDGGSVTRRYNPIPASLAKTKAKHYRRPDAPPSALIVMGILLL